MKLRIAAFLAAVCQFICWPAPVLAGENLPPVKTASTVKELVYKQGFAWMFGDTEESARILKLLQKENPKTERALIRFVFDDFVFAEVYVKPNFMIADGYQRPSFIAIKLGSDQVVRLPDQMLFKHAMQMVRSNPDGYDLAQRIRLAIILATGYDNYLPSSDKDVSAPNWSESDGVLKIHYFRSTGINVFPKVQKCTLSADANNVPELSCQ